MNQTSLIVNTSRENLPDTYNSYISGLETPRQTHWFSAKKAAYPNVTSSQECGLQVPFEKPSLEVTKRLWKGHFLTRNLRW